MKGLNQSQDHNLIYLKCRSFQVKNKIIYQRVSYNVNLLITRILD